MEDLRHEFYRDPGSVDAVLGNCGAVSEYLKALAHEGRLRILCHLVEGEKSVSELEELLGARQAAVSQQLARLRHEGLVQGRRDGKAILYSLGEPKVRPLIETLQMLFRDESEL